MIDPVLEKLRLSTPYDILGANITQADFESRWVEVEKTSPETSQKIAGACSRIQLVEALQYEARFPGLWEQVQSEALQVYLLCTCFDALAGRAIRGVGRNFRKFFKGLPEPLRLELIGSYAIIKEPKETTANWQKLSEEERLRRVVDYLYLLRRNTFTHEAKIVPTLTPNQGVSGWVCAIHHGIWDYAVYLSNLDEVRGEVSLLRIIAVGAMRRMLGFSSDRTFLDLHWEIERHKRLFRQIYAELVQNERIAFIYLRDDAPNLIDQPRRAMWRFKDEAAKRLQKRPDINLAWFGVDDTQVREGLSSYVGIIEQMNEAIKQYETEARNPTASGEGKASAYEGVRQVIRESQIQNVLVQLAVPIDAMLHVAPQIIK